ncbi:unnamed protein product [Eruca vesicaria subsp. sativa]|uniref:Ribosomal protein eL8/eL30/eS12/Gadd45 domain-containing protein n=1 Tax=Eruca vesicaria subsp. sativa TaxID=29727 RepID=A0ABC8LT09_ERUVS|nr:unnamed protein product [Eruca vesicaria subsp. sativa]
MVVLFVISMRVLSLLRSVAQPCVLAEDCNHPDYVKLVKALCADHNINLLTVPSAKILGEWAGLCKIYSEGMP